MDGLLNYLNSSEGNLKTYRALKETAKLRSIWKLKARIECEEPNPHIGTFNGRIIIDGKSYSLDHSQLLLRVLK